MPLTFSKTVHPIDFSALSGHEFERLVFATLLRMYAWDTLDWFGQSGGDKGRDIVGIRDDEYGNKITVVVACANWKSFSSTKGVSDISRLVNELQRPPHQVVIVSGGGVSASTKENCEKHAKSLGIASARVWSGSELEENLRFHAASVLQRFFNGEEFPNESSELRGVVHQLDPTTEREAGELIARLFKRPAFTTPIHGESSLPAFRQAISDTIGALNTGIWRDREGAIISRIPSSQSFPIHKIRDALSKSSEALNSLRIAFDAGMRAGGIRPCKCGKSDCPVFAIEPENCEHLERLRSDALRFANEALTGLGVPRIC